MNINNEQLYLYCNQLKEEEKKYEIAVKNLQETMKMFSTNQKLTKQKGINMYKNLLKYNKDTQGILTKKIELAQKGLQVTTYLIQKDASKNLNQQLPLWEGESTPLCGKVPCKNGYIGSVGDLVAASVSTNGQKSMILCHIKSFNQQSQTYQLVDYFEDINKQPAYYSQVQKQNVIPLPSSLSAHHHPQTEFQKGEQVLAVYPNTTTFYPAQVLASPGSRSKNGRPTFDYLLHFKGDTLEQQEIYSRFVLPLPVKRN